MVQRYKIISSVLISVLLMQATSVRAIAYAGPLVVNDAYVAANGDVVMGNFQGTASQPAITVSTTKMVTIINSNVQGPADLIYAQNANLRVINCTGTGTNPNVHGAAKGMFVHVEGAINLQVKNCTINGTSFGVYINRYVGNLNAAQTISITNNQVINIDGRASDGKNGYLTTVGQQNAHAFQLNGIYAVPNIQIAWNQIINQPAASYVSDIINVYNSSGTSASPILIHDNYLQGAYPINPGTDTSYTGGGIICDGQTTQLSQATAHVSIYNNQVVATANYGLAIASGNNNTIYNNRVVSSGKLASGKLYPMTFAVGIYNWNSLNQPSTLFFNNIVQNNNPVGLIAQNASGVAERSDWWLPGQTASGNNVSFQPYSAQAPTLADEANEYQTWLAKVKTNGQIIGNNCSSN